MDLIMTWVVFVGLATVLFYSSKKEQPAHAEAAHRDGKVLPRNRVARMFATYTALDWGLFLGAVCFLIAAIVGTVAALF
ncbi:hypothetical protein ACIPVK_00295 [Paeniglutamicibacter sp. MACA_103]|uniref:hypothetical protein n=1 Tax=Paeniglutamicibacter sp. MACA_103 TaxID=3377337 RepID=UPI003894CDCD